MGEEEREEEREEEPFLVSARLRSQQSFHGVDLSSLRQAAIAEYFRQPIVVRKEL